MGCFLAIFCAARSVGGMIVGMTSPDIDPLYLRELLAWAIHTIGCGLGWSLFVAVAVAVIGAATGEAWVIALSGLAGAVTFAAKLANSWPPWPSEIEALRARSVEDTD